MMDEQLTVESLAANERFQNYCLQLNASDEIFFEQWLQEHPEHKELFAAAKALVLQLSLSPTEEEVQAEYNRFKQVIQAQEDQPAPARTHRNRRPLRKSLSNRRIAIAATLLLLVVLAIWQLVGPIEQPQAVVMTNFGEVKTYTLPDSSQVTINANSSIRFESNWGNSKERRVSLQGEAFFEVKPLMDKQPFLVETAQGTVRVLGTSFNVTQRAAAFEVALMEGEVELSVAQNPTTLMQAGEIARLNSEGILEKRNFDLESAAAWRFQKMVFKEVPIKNIIQRLKNEFDLEVRVDNQDLLLRKVNATIPKNDPVLLLEALSEIYDLEFERLGDKIYTIK